MANKTVYPFGVGGQLPGNIGIVNDLKTGGADKALSAEMGKEIAGGEEIVATIDLTDYSENSFIINALNKWEDTPTSKCVLIPLGKTQHISIEMDGGNGMIAFLKSTTHTAGTTPDFSSSYQARIQITDGNSAEYDVPEDATYLYVATHSSTDVDVRPFYDIVFSYYEIGLVYKSDLDKWGREAIIEVELERGAYNSTGGFSIGNVMNDAYLRTPNFLKLPADGLWGVMTDSDADMVVIRYFDADYDFLSGVSATALESGDFTEFTAPEGAVYVKMNFRNSTTTDIIPGKAYFKGRFTEENPIFYNVRPSDNGYQTLEVRVRLFNPTDCDTQTDSVQDNSAEGADYGVLAIPSQYVNRGTPTRLIIYCHGAAVNYADNASRFDSQDLDPAYWLSEGYAVMDVEGNPFDNTNEHFAIPQAYQCYKAAYEWVINHYNIRKDGVFLGGRSMGGLMTLDIITQERGIPIIAACPNVPCIIPTWYWNYMSSARRTFCANHLGFTNQPTWGGTSPMPTAEWNCLKANFDKLALASPFWRLLNDLPDKDDLFNGTNVSKSSNDPTPLLAVYGNCRMRIKTPTKLFICRDDDVAIPEMNGDILAKIAKQSGQIFVVREFEDGGHHYDTQNSDLQVTITNTYGVSITTSVVYIEMLAWWREWEQRG